MAQRGNMQNFVSFVPSCKEKYNRVVFNCQINKIELFAGVALGHLAGMKKAANFGPKFHVLKHGARRGKGREQFRENFPEIVPECPLLSETRAALFKCRLH